jgi:hypothetical protein
MNRLLMALAVVLSGNGGATADELNFPSAPGKRLKTEISPPGVPSVDRTTWTATCRRGISISGHCETHDSGFRHLQSFGSDGVHRFCKWTEPVTKATVTALCLFEE